MTERSSLKSTTTAPTFGDTVLPSVFTPCPPRETFPFPQTYNPRNCGAASIFGLGFVSAACGKLLDIVGGDISP